MPELPEVETVRRTLEPRLIGRRVGVVTIRRRDVCRCFSLRAGVCRAARASPAALLEGATIASLERHGKHLAILASDGRAMDVHLGMSGLLVAGDRPPPGAKHLHVAWALDAGGLWFIDPRRFGGVWAYPDAATLRTQRWAVLGPDALTISAEALAGALAGSRAPIKAALLDQTRLAGVGNIYADEALFAARLPPTRTAGTLDAGAISSLAAAIRAVLAAAVAARGSTIRDYRAGDGLPGDGSLLHRVYGRAGLECSVCGHRLRGAVVAQRTTTWCPVCQR